MQNQVKPPPSPLLLHSPPPPLLYHSLPPLLLRQNTCSPPPPYTDTYLRTLNLSGPFTLNDPNSTPFTFTPNPPAVPEISSGALWPQKSTLYLAGGVTEPVNTNFPNWTDTNTNALWTYQPASNNDTHSNGIWRTLQTPLRYPSGEKIVGSAGSNAAYVDYGGASTGYLLGGNQNPWASIGYPGMLAYDFAAETWQNLSTPFMQASSGALLHVPIGEKGILVSLGGTRNNNPFTFNQVDVYNIDRASWSLQQPARAAIESTGVPEPRTAFCAVLVSAPDRTSFEIFVYGGSLAGDGAGGAQLEDVWVLSIPSFEWFNVYSGTTNTSTAAAGKREAHSCHAVAGRQMLVYGGRTKPQETCDKTGVFVFDMVSLDWQTEFKPAAGPYQVPSMVANHLAAASS